MGNKIKIPKQFKIFGHKYTIKQVPSIKNGTAYALHDFDNKQILLEDTLTKTKTEEYLLHEILHAILEHNGYEALSQDEVFIERISRGLHQVLNTLK